MADHLYSYPHFEQRYVLPSNRSFGLPHSGQVPRTLSSNAFILLSSLSASCERLIHGLFFHHFQASSLIRPYCTQASNDSLGGQLPIIIQDV